MKSIKFLLLILFSGFSFLNAQIVEIEDARIVAKNYLFERSVKAIEDLSFNVTEINDDQNEPVYYVFNSKDGNGFVVVSAEMGYFPVIAYSEEGVFITENQIDNVRSWMKHYEDQIEYIRNRSDEVPADVLSQWDKYNVPFDEFKKINVNKLKAVEPLAGHILWNQDNGWNDLCPEDGGGPGGHVYAGCVATAMGIVMKYWNYPVHGTGSYSYYCPGYGTLTANFGEATYFWDNMEDETANLFSAHLLYHCGVSVGMSYGPDGSGAFSFDVDDALEDYFQYSTDAQYVQKSSYSQTNWINLLKAQIDAGYPVYYSGRDSDNGGHAFVCSGYDNSDNFHFNFGWSGSNNGYYSVNDVGGFYNDQAAVINVYPAESNVYPTSPNSITAILDNSNVNDFKVDIEWEAPVTKDVSNYLLYRDLELIATLPSTQTTYSESPDAGNYYYSVAALYQNGDESLTVTDFLTGLFSVTFYAVDASGGSNITQAQVSFNGQVKPTTFVGAVFADVAYGGDYYYEITHEDYQTATGYVDILEHSTFTVQMQSAVDISQNDENGSVNVYPNPANNFLTISGIDFITLDYEIFDVTGKLIKYGEISNHQQIDLSGLNMGFYILKLNSDEFTVKESFIKK